MVRLSLKILETVKYYLFYNAELTNPQKKEIAPKCRKIAYTLTLFSRFRTLRQLNFIGTTKNYRQNKGKRLHQLSLPTA